MESLLQPESFDTPRLLRLAGVLRLIPLSRSEWYRRVAAGEAPRPIALGPRARAWREQDIQGYIQALEVVQHGRAL